MTLIQVEPSGTTQDEQFTLVQNLSNLYQMAKARKQQYTGNWKRNYLLVNNRNYSIDAPQPWSPNATDSEIFPILSSRIGWLLDQRLSFELSVEATPGSAWAQHQQELASQMEQLLDTMYTIGQWDRQVLLACWDSAINGAGIFKCAWDSGLDSGMGNVQLLRVDPWTFYPDPNCNDMTDMQYCFEVHKWTMTEIERKFPDTSHALLDELRLAADGGDDGIGRPQTTWSPRYPMANPGNLPGSNATAWGLPGQSGTGAANVLDNGVNVYECWIRENYRDERDTTDASQPIGSTEEVVFDQWRVVVYSGNHVLLDELAVNLWEHDRHPYERFVDEEMGEFWGTPITSHLAPCQTSINRLLSSIQANAELIGNPIFMDVAGSGLSRTQIVNRPGLRLQKSGAAATQGNAQPDWLRPPELSQFVLQTVQFWIGRMENISGLSGPQKGQPTSGRQAQQTVQATQEAGFVRIRSALRNLERTLGACGNLLANLIVQNYDVPRVVAIIGEEGKDTAIRFAARHFYMPRKDPKSGKVIAVPMKFSLVCRMGSQAPTSRQARIAEIDALAAMGMVDRLTVLQYHGIKNAQMIDQKMAQQQAMAAAAKQGGKGQPTGPGTGHEH